MSNDPRFIESVQGHIGYGATSTARGIRLLDFMKEFTKK